MLQSHAQGNENTTNGLADLYQEIIVDHSRRPRFKGKPEGCAYCQDGKNPLCGDEITVFCKLEAEGNHTIHPKISVQFTGSGCSISQASASMMCDSLQNVDVKKARECVRQAEGIYTGKEVQINPEDVEQDIEALFGVSKFPVRIKCAALGWKTLELLLNENFDEHGNPKQKIIEASRSDTLARPMVRKLKVVSTEI